MQVMSVGICGPGAASIKGLPRVGGGVWGEGQRSGAVRAEGRVRGHGQRPQSPPHSVLLSRCPQAPAGAAVSSPKPVPGASAFPGCTGLAWVWTRCFSS